MTPESIAAAVTTGVEEGVKKAHANGNGKQRWTAFVPWLLTAIGMSAGLSMTIFYTRAEASEDKGEVSVSLSAKSDKKDCEAHEKLPAHREQVMVNKQQVETNSRILGILDRIETVVRETAVETGIERRQVNRMAPRPRTSSP